MIPGRWGGAVLGQVGLRHGMAGVVRFGTARLCLLCFGLAGEVIRGLSG